MSTTQQAIEKWNGTVPQINIPSPLLDIQAYHMSAGESTLCIIGILLALMVALRSLYDAVTGESPLCKAGNTWVCIATTYTAGHLIWLAIQYW